MFFQQWQIVVAVKQSICVVLKVAGTLKHIENWCGVVISLQT